MSNGIILAWSFRRTINQAESIYYTKNEEIPSGLSTTVWFSPNAQNEAKQQKTKNVYEISAEIIRNFWGKTRNSKKTTKTTK